MGCASVPCPCPCPVAVPCMSVHVRSARFHAARSRITSAAPSRAAPGRRHGRRDGRPPDAAAEHHATRVATRPDLQLHRGTRPHTRPRDARPGRLIRLQARDFTIFIKLLRCTKFRYSTFFFRFASRRPRVPRRLALLTFLLVFWSRRPLGLQSAQSYRLGPRRSDRHRSPVTPDRPDVNTRRVSRLPVPLPYRTCGQQSYRAGRLRLRRGSAAGLCGGAAAGGSCLRPSARRLVEESSARR